MACSLGIFVDNLVDRAAVGLPTRCHRLHKCLCLNMRRLEQLINCFILVIVAHGADHVCVKHPLVSFVYVVEFVYLGTIKVAYWMKH